MSGGNGSVALTTHEENSNVDDIIDNPKHWMYGIFNIWHHLAMFYGKCREIYHTLSVWECYVNLCNVKWCLSEEIHGRFVHVWQCGSPDELVSVCKNPESDRQYSLHPWSMGNNVNTKKHEQLRYPWVNRINIDQWLEHSPFIPSVLALRNNSVFSYN